MDCFYRISSDRLYDGIFMVYCRGLDRLFDSQLGG